MMIKSLIQGVSKFTRLKIIVVVAIAIAASLYYFSNSCGSSPECACKSAQPGDPTCITPDEFLKWCEQQTNKKGLPQCHF